MRKIFIVGAALMALAACGQTERVPLTNTDIYLGGKGDSVITAVVSEVSTHETDTNATNPWHCREWVRFYWINTGDCDEGHPTLPPTKTPPVCQGSECHPVEPPCTENCNPVVEILAKFFPITASDRAEDASGKERNKDVGTNYETETSNRHDNSVKEDTDTENNPSGDDDDATDGETSTPPNNNPRAAFNR